MLRLQFDDIGTSCRRVTRTGPRASSLSPTSVGAPWLQPTTPVTIPGRLS